MMMPVETQKTTFYPPITPVSTNLPVKAVQFDKQVYTAASSQSDRSISADCLSSSSASSSSSSSRMPIKKRKVKVSCSSTEDYASSMQEDDKENSRFDKPILTSSGKLKKYRCKRCPYVAITKCHFWNHSRIHIKPEKLLICPECPFVTEYRHHLKFHRLNHSNSKPFKCDKCNYSGVSKNMLDSHLKSHSDLRKYRCAECSFANKYFHPLKLHLNKSKHKEGFMLSDDGSVNLNNVITAHGIKRVKMPKKTKKVKKEAKPLHQPAALVDGCPSTMLPLQSNPVNVMPIALHMPYYCYDQIYTDMSATLTNFVKHQVSEVCQIYEQSAPLDYSQKSTPSVSPSYDTDSEEQIDVVDLVDASDMSSMPLDLSKPKSLHVDYNIRCAEGEN